MTKEIILIIENNYEIRYLLKKALSRMERYHVIEAANGEVGLERALNDKPSVILLDLMLPQRDGLEILEALNAQGRRIPTIIITADSRPETILRAFRLGAKDFLQKPFEMPQMQSALENALTEERLRREKENLTKALAKANRRQQRQLDNWAALNFIARTISSTLEESEVLHRVVATAKHLLHVEAGSVLLLDEKNETLHFAVTLGEQTTHPPSGPVPLGEGLAGWVAQQGEPLMVPDVRQDARFEAEVDQIPGLQTRSVICVPLKSRERILGVFEVINKQSKSSNVGFTAEDLKLLQTLTSWITIAVENARLYRSLQQHTATKTLKQTVVTLAHHINNELMAYALELDNLEQSTLQNKEKVEVLISSARKCSQRISAVVKAMGRLTDIRTTPYIGSEDMLDIEDLLADA